MIFLNFKKYNLLLFILFIFVGSCNYKPLINKDQLNQLKISNIEISGNKRISQIIVNKLNIIKEKEGNFELSVYGEKNTIVTNKSTSGKILEYGLTLICSVEVKNNLTGKVIYSKKIENSENYKSSEMYSDTISDEKKIIENLSNLIAKQIINEISLVLRNDS